MSLLHLRTPRQEPRALAALFPQWLAALEGAPPRLALLLGALTSLPVSGCAPALPTTGEVIRSVRFRLQAGDAPLDCQSGVTGLGISASTGQLSDLRLYVGEFVVGDDQGREVSLDMPDAAGPEGGGQGGGVALLDFEDGTGACSEFGDGLTNDRVYLSFPPGAWTSLSFSVGVPEEDNHLDATSRGAPLNVPAMFWGWQLGYKFVKAEFLLEDGGAWELHLGSSGCVSDGSSMAPQEACTHPNRVRVTLGEIDLSTDQVIFDLAELVAEIDLADPADPGSAGCRSELDELVACSAVFNALGLDPATGECGQDCASQRVFRVYRPMDPGP